MSDTKTICIDSCVLVSFLKGGSDRTAEDSAQLKGFFNDVSDGKVHLIFPTLLRCEFLSCNHTPEIIENFDNLTRLPKIDEIPLTMEIAKLAGEIRNLSIAENKRAPDGNHKIATSDAIFLATAIANQCEALFTYDGDRPAPMRPNKVLGLTSPIYGKYQLNICKPYATQLGM